MSILDLNGNNVTLPDGTVFTTSYLTGSNGVTNNGFSLPPAGRPARSESTDDFLYEMMNNAKGGC